MALTGGRGADVILDARQQESGKDLQLVAMPVEGDHRGQSRHRWR